MKYKGKISDYLYQSFGWDVKFEELGPLGGRIPFGLMGSADYSVVIIEGLQAVAVRLSDKNGFRMIKNLAMTIRKLVGLPVVMILEDIDSYQRKSLIENKINFIVCGRQIYLPSIGTLLNERGLGVAPPKTEELSSVATTVIIYHLVRLALSGMSVSDIAAATGYSVKSLSLAISELEHHELVSVIRQGRSKKIQFPGDKYLLWEKAYPLMPNPVERKLFTDNLQSVTNIGVKASDTALYEISMLAGPQQDVYAVYGRNPDIKELNLNPNDGAVMVEVWKINPLLTAKNGIADACSLALSYKNDDDPRINIELGKVLNETLSNR